MNSLRIGISAILAIGYFSCRPVNEPPIPKLGGKVYDMAGYFDPTKCEATRVYHSPDELNNMMPGNLFFVDDSVCILVQFPSTLTYIAKGEYRIHDNRLNVKFSEKELTDETIFWKTNIYKEDSTRHRVRAHAIAESEIIFRPLSCKGNLYFKAENKTGYYGSLNEIIDFKREMEELKRKRILYLLGADDNNEINYFGPKVEIVKP